MAYHGILEANWKTGLHDIRGIPNYQHHWLVVHRESGTVRGFFNREQARNFLRSLKRGVPADLIDQV